MSAAIGSKNSSALGLMCDHPCPLTMTREMTREGAPPMTNMITKQMTSLTKPFYFLPLNFDRLLHVDPWDKPGRRSKLRVDPTVRNAVAKTAPLAAEVKLEHRTAQAVRWYRFPQERLFALHRPERPDLVIECLKGSSRGWWRHHRHGKPTKRRDGNPQHQHQ